MHELIIRLPRSQTWKGNEAVATPQNLQKHCQSANK